MADEERGTSPKTGTETQQPPAEKALNETRPPDEKRPPGDASEQATKKSKRQVPWYLAAEVVRRGRQVLATAAFTVAVLAALVLALGALLVALDANEQNSIVSGIIDLAHQFDGPFADIFTFDSAVKQTLVNWGIAAAVYLIVGRVLERLIRP